MWRHAAARGTVGRGTTGLRGRGLPCHSRGSSLVPSSSSSLLPSHLHLLRRNHLFAHLAEAGPAAPIFRAAGRQRAGWAAHEKGWSFAFRSRRVAAGWTVRAAARRHVATQAALGENEQEGGEHEDDDDDGDEEEFDDWDDDDEEEEDVVLGQDDDSDQMIASAKQRAKKQSKEATREEWLPLREHKKRMLEAELEALHERMLEGEKIDADHLARFAHRRCLLVRDSNDGVLQYIWDLAKVGCKLGVIGPSALGAVMGRFAAHNRTELAQEAYNYIIESNQQSDAPNTSKIVPIKQKDLEHLIRAIAHKGEAGRALELLTQLGSQEPKNGALGLNQKPVHPDTFRSVLAAVTQPQDIDSARKLLRSMEEQTKTLAKDPSSRTVYNSLLAGYNALNDPEGALRVWVTMKQNKSIKPDLWSYVEAAESHVRLGDKDSVQKSMDEIAEKLNEQLDTMRRAQLEADDLTLDDEDDVAEEEDLGSRRNGPRTDPSLDLWNKVLSHFVRNGHVAESFAIWRRMREAHLAPNARTALLLIRACVRNKDMDRAHQVVGNMRKYHDLKVSADGWTEIVEGYADQEQFDLMWRSVEKMYREGVLPNDHTWEVVERCCRSKNVWDKYEAKVERMKRTIDADQKRKQKAFMKRAKPRAAEKANGSRRAQKTA